MATRTKKKKSDQEEKLGFMDAFKALGEERGIAPEILFEAIEKALASAYKKNYSNHENCSVELNRVSGEYHVYAIKRVVDEVEDPVNEISLAMAQQKSPDYQVGDTLQEEVTPANFGRIAAQNAKQVVVQAIREAERCAVLTEFSDRQDDIVTGSITRIENRNIYIDLGKTEAILAPSEQIDGEEYNIGDRIKAIIITVRTGTKGGPQIMVSRSHPNLLKRLFELEVPEIQSGVVEIKSVAREPGKRSKIAVYAPDEDIDAVGSCVGQRGLRVQTIVDELRNEKIDIVKWSEAPGQYIANALSPAKVVDVYVKDEAKVSRVIVPDNQLSLAIGKEGQNARLAAKLTNWKIDIKSVSQAQEEDAFEETVADEPQDDGDIMAELGQDMGEDTAE